MKTALLIIVLLSLGQLVGCVSGRARGAKLVYVDEGWANTQINAIVFRRNAVVTHGAHQYVAYYDPQGRVTLAKRELGSEAWDIRTTPYVGNVRDAHNSISLMVDGDGYLHLSWDHHNHPLRYCQSREPGGLELTEKLGMTGQQEDRVTYPEFYRLPNGNLLFFYRNGSSGRGNLIMNHFDLATRQWTQRHATLIDGQDQRNAYWQLTTDTQNVIHLSWNWRDTGDVATNHDLMYAKSLDQGQTWVRSDGSPQTVPITKDNAEVAWRVPRNHELINTTSMCADAEGRPYLATYWRPPGTTVPQYHLVFHDGQAWNVQQISQRTTPFSLAGGGTKSIPVARPQILARIRDGKTQAFMVYRDEERGRKISLAVCDDLSTQRWRHLDLTDFSVDAWEPSYDTELWQRDQQLHLFVQPVQQADGDRGPLEEGPPQPISILEWSPD